MSGQSDAQKLMCTSEGALLVAGATPDLVEGTADVGLAGRTKSHRFQTRGVGAWGMW